MNIYLVVDTSVRMILSESLATTTNFLCNFVDYFDKSEANVALVSLDNDPKVVCEKVVSSNDIHNAELFSKKFIVSAGLPNFEALLKLVLARQCELTNYELIIILEATSYYRIPEDFRLPCAIYFVGVTGTACAPALLTQFEVISHECAIGAGIINAKKNLNSNSVTRNDMVPVDEFQPLQISVQLADSTKKIANVLAKKKRTENNATLSISPNFTIDVCMTPGISKRPLAIFDPELLFKEMSNNNTSGVDSLQCGRISPPHPTPASLFLLGFIKAANFLLHLPSTSLIHALKPKVSDSNVQAFHLFAEALGAEGQLAIFQHTNGEECIVRALRSDAADPWLLCMQFYSSNYFTWAAAADAAAVATAAGTNTAAIVATVKAKMEAKGISYKANTQRSYWTDAHGLQSDVLKISRLLKRADRLEQFYQEIQRVSLHAVACGYDSFAEPMATLLEKRCTNIPPENKEHLAKVLDALRKGGFRLISKSRG